MDSRALRKKSEGLIFSDINALHVSIAVGADVCHEMMTSNCEKRKNKTGKEIDEMLCSRLKGSGQERRWTQIEEGVPKKKGARECRCVNMFLT